ncbi:hypothetical protein N7G274_008876 [Stereocaulon virgatum]|uniref:Uncharacterized protein n=1 Tax=Stereocaulon virgatum TaxID=373712 RepID=A0ABR4A2D9_9LECA
MALKALAARPIAYPQMCHIAENTMFSVYSSLEVLLGNDSDILVDGLLLDARLRGNENISIQCRECSTSVLLTRSLLSFELACSVSNRIADSGGSTASMSACTWHS